jgi:hypothetical protein
MMRFKFQTQNFKLKTPNSERGVILIVVFMLIVVVSMYLPGYVVWTIWDQRNLIRQQRAEEARALAQAGLDRARLDLFMDKGSWLDGRINTTAVHVPDINSPDTFWTLYTFLNWTLPYGGFGTYTVWIDYLENPSTCVSGCTFFDKRMLVRSTGTVPGAMSTLEEYVRYNVVRNLTRIIDYANLQPAINDVITGNWNNDIIGITDTVLVENITISPGGAINFTIRGCYDPTWTFRSCMDYHTTIQGNWTVSGNATVDLSGVTID